MEATDELSNQVYSVPVASLRQEEDMSLMQKYFIINPYSKQNKPMSLAYSLDSKAYKEVVDDKEIIRDITFVDSGSQFISNATIKVKVRRCRPGFIFKFNQCVCNNSPGSHIVRYYYTYRRAYFCKSFILSRVLFVSGLGFLEFHLRTGQTRDGSRVHQTSAVKES